MTPDLYEQADKLIDSTKSVQPEELFSAAKSNYSSFTNVFDDLQVRALELE
jgi:hypothetical protein